MGDKDVVRAVDIAFRYRNYFRKVCLLPCYGKGNPYQADGGRTSLWIFWFIEDGVFSSCFLLLLHWLTYSLKGGKLSTPLPHFGFKN